MVMDEDVLAQLEREVTVLLRRAERVRLGAAERAGSNLDRSGYLLLLQLSEMGAVGVTALAQRLALDASTITRQIARLVDTGLVLREPDEEDRRAVRHRLTPAGRRELANLRKARRDLFSELLEDWSEEDRERFARLLVRFNDSLSRHGT